jgi:phosphate uptake regulator
MAICLPRIQLTLNRNREYTRYSTGFDPALESLRADVLLMGSLVRRNFANARAGFEQRDDDRCAAVIADGEEVDLLERLSDAVVTIARRARKLK